MKNSMVRIGEGGRVVIPAEFRRAAGVSVGDDLVLLLEEGKMRLLTRRQALEEAQALVRQYVSADRSLADELVAERRAEVEAEGRGS